MSDRKIPVNYENPIDNLIIHFGRKIYPLYRKLNMTANDLTTVSLITGLISIFCLYKQHFILSALFYAISYSYDVFDGNYARTYKLVSTFGDYYDHIKDIIINILLIIVFLFFSKFSKKGLIIISIITIILFILLNIHLACQELYVMQNDAKNNSDFLLNLLKIFPANLNHIEYFRWVGCGTFALWISFIILMNEFI